MFTSPFSDSLSEDLALRGLSPHAKRVYTKWAA